MTTSVVYMYALICPNPQEYFVALNKVIIDKFNGRSRGFCFVTFDEKKAMEEAIEAMNGMDLDGRNIIVEKAQNPGSGRDQEAQNPGSGRDQDGDRSRVRGRDRDCGSYHDSGNGRGSNGGECVKYGKPDHFARDCPSEGGGGSRYGGRDDRYGGGDDRYGGGEGGGGFGPDRNGDHSGGRSRDFGNRGGPGNDRYNRDRSGPYE